MKKFTDSHEWVEMETSTLARIGISQYAQKELGEIVYVELPKEKSFITSPPQKNKINTTIIVVNDVMTVRFNVSLRDKFTTSFSDFLMNLGSF